MGTASLGKKATHAKPSVDLCLNLTERAYLSAFEKNTTQDFVSTLAHKHKNVSFLFDLFPFNRIYVGAEFCWKLMLPIRELMSFADLALARDIEVTFVTPPVFMATYEPVKSFLAKIDDLGKKRNRPLEVVVNDWGLLRLVAKQHGSLRPVLGRVMNKMKKDPRYDLNRDPHFLGRRRCLRQSSLNSEMYRKFLASLGVERVELDLPEQGLDMAFGAWKLEPSVHVPYVYVASGRRCLPSVISRPFWQKGMLVADCSRECRREGYAMDCSGTTGYLFRGDKGFSAMARPAVVAVGNTVFFELPCRDSLNRVDLEGAGISRVVTTLGPPH